MKNDNFAQEWNKAVLAIKQPKKKTITTKRCITRRSSHSMTFVYKEEIN